MLPFVSVWSPLTCPSADAAGSPAPEPTRRKALVEALHKHVRRRTEFRWVRMRLDESIARTGGSVQRAVAGAVALRAHVTEAAGEVVLRRMGATVERIRPHGEIGLPVRADRVVAEHENVAHAGRAGTVSCACAMTRRFIPPTDVFSA